MNFPLVPAEIIFCDTKIGHSLVSLLTCCFNCQDVRLVAYSREDESKRKLGEIKFGSTEDGAARVVRGCCCARFSCESRHRCSNKEEFLAYRFAVLFCVIKDFG